MSQNQMNTSKVDSVSQTNREHKFSARLHGEYNTGIALKKHY